MLKRNINPAAGARMAAEQPALYHLYNHVYGLTGGFDREAVRARLHAGRNRPPESFAPALLPPPFSPSGEDIVLSPFAAPAPLPKTPLPRWRTPPV